MPWQCHICGLQVDTRTSQPHPEFPLHLAILRLAEENSMKMIMMIILTEEGGNF